MKLHLLLLIALLSFIPHTLHAQIQGTWHSNFQVAGKSLLMDLQVEGIGRDGSITVSIPDEEVGNLVNYKLIEITINELAK